MMTDQQQSLDICVMTKLTAAQLGSTMTELVLQLSWSKVTLTLCQQLARLADYDE